MSDAAGPTAEIADFVLATRFADLPAPVVKEGLRSFFNVLGCSLGGARHTAVERTWAALAPVAGAPHATLIGRGARTDALTATLLNTLASSIATNDDTHAEAIVHPSGPVMAAVLAVAERRTVTGADALAAFIVGVEVVCRLSKAVSVAPAKGSIAWSQTGICCGVGAAVAAARLMRLDAAATRQAIGHAASQASGLRAAHGTMCTAMMPAIAGQSGLRAALFAAAGVTSTETVFEHRYGFAACFAEEPEMDYLTGDLGTRWEILGNTYNPFPCGIVINPLIDAALQLRAEHGLTGAEIERVDMKVSPGAIALCDRRQPKDELEGQVSLYHWTAAALSLGRAGVAEGQDAMIRDPALSAFRERIFAVQTSDMPIDGVDMTVALKDGRRLEKRLRNCIGSKANPMTDAQLEAKLASGAVPVLGPERTKRLIAETWALASLPDASVLARIAA
jgi:2-methylcitrate dehydratase PrpD